MTCRTTALETGTPTVVPLLHAVAARWTTR